MKKVILFSLIFIFAVFNWSLNPAMKQAEATTWVYLVSPADSTKMTESNPTFKWKITGDIWEKVRKYYIALDTILTDPFEPTSPVWEDSTCETIKIDTNGTTIDTTRVPPAKSIDYDGPPLVEWETYFWSVRVLVDIIDSIRTIDTRVDTYWTRDQLYSFKSPPRIFFYTTATLIEIPDSLPTIQEGIIWAAAGDTILVEPGVYYENLRFYKDSVILASHFARDTTNIAIIDSTIIDGDSLTRKEENGSVIYFTSNVDSTSWVIGFTIRNGKGTKADVGVEEKVNGGGIFCDVGSTPTIAFNVITQNHVPDDGGGIFCYSAASNIFDNIITKNSAGGSGGAIQCYHSIRTKPSLSSGPTGGKGEKDGEIEIMPKPGFSSPWETEKTSPSPESNSKTKDDLKNSLYPRDATEAFSALSSDPLAKSAQNDPPVAVLKYYPVKPKYFVGDIIWLLGYESYDPDSLEGDSVMYHKYTGEKWQSCESPDEWKSWTGQVGFPLDSLEFRVTAKMGGLYRIWLIVKDTHMEQSDPSDTIYLNLQRAPTADAGDTVGIAPGDIAWLDGSGSCDINPDDTTLSYYWTQISGPIISIDTTTTPPETTFLWVTLVEDSTISGIDTNIVDSDTSFDTTYYSPPFNPYPYFETKDSSYYLGEYQFQLVVCDSCDPYVDTVVNILYIDTTQTPPDTTFDITFVSGCDTAMTVVNCSRPPVVECPPDSLFGYDVGGPVPLGGFRASDPDEEYGDYVKYFIWEGLTRTTCAGTRNFSSDMWDSPGTIIVSEQETTYVEFQKGGIYELSLYVKDSYRTRSENTCTLKISVQLRPEADAGPDTIVRPKRKTTLHGSACEVNWDQVDFLQYEWQQDTTGGADRLKLNPKPDTQEVYCYPSKGVYRLSLRVTDPYGASSRPDDTVRVIVNQLPEIDGISPDPNDTTYAEGDPVELTVWAHDADDDIQIYGDSLTYKWTTISWPESYQPTIIDSTEPTMKFVPLKHGEYMFQVVVHDTISPNQYPPVEKGFNIHTFTVRVDTTLAYPFIMGNLISSNTAGLKGGGIDCIRSSPDIINNIFYTNKSGSSGGAICTQNTSTPQIKNNIFFGNISSDSTGGAIADLKVQLSPSASIGFKEKMVVAHNDFWNNAGGDLYQPPADVFGNIYVYPRLVDPEYDDFRLECSSPCIGAGEDSSDIGSLKLFQPCFNIDTLRMVSLSLFQNPVATAVAHFLVNTDVPLKAPPMAWVTIGEYSAVPIHFTHVFSTTYRGDFIFTSSGTAHITVFANSVLEQDTSITRDFAVQLIEAGKIGKLVSHDNQLGVLFPQGVAKGKIYATCIPVSDDPQYKFEDEDKVVSGEAYHLGPPSDFKKELTLSFPLDDYDLTEKDKTLFSIYRYEKNGWERKASFLDENLICAKVKNLGVYRLVYDARQEHITAIPKTYELFQNYPNPFNPQTVIKYDLPKSGHVNITVYNILGQKVKTLVNEHQEAGHQSVNWNGKDGKEKDVASGIYFYKIKTVGFEKTKKMVLLK